MRSFIGLVSSLVGFGLMLAPVPHAIADTLSQRVEAYWQALESRDWATAFEMEKESQGEGAIGPFDYYHRMEPQPRYRAFKVQSVEESGTSGTSVTLALIVVPIGPNSIDVPRHFRSQWENVAGTWYHVKSEAFRPDVSGAAKRDQAAPAAQ